MRLAQPEDADALAEISRRSLHYAWSERDFLITIKNPQAKVYLAEGSDGAAGYVVLYHAADEGEIASVGVHPSQRRRGIGSRILGYMMEQCGTFGVKKLFLEVRESNDAAQGLYESFGFLRVGVRKDFYDSPKEDAFLMMRIL